MTKPLFVLTLCVAVGMIAFGGWSIRQMPKAGAPAPAASGPVVDLLAQARQAPGAQVLPSGVVVEVLQAGQGRKPRATDTVKVHYRGVMADGTEFDSSYRRGQPAEFPLDKVIACWTQGLQELSAGAKARLTCPAATAYGERGAGGLIPPGAVLQFEVELLGLIF
ncbi:FKBP-type peptidyl-prolyl cis-trans isomerase [Ideonella sp. TBM-1]|uniref:Peptidyl-prolyl cis-trans isomerase n=2 Tax=Ideonella livida TaxID=2707176 RepID=A0A7C9TK93_9BURK|nr:FKBP-type peptidyl-prolyl cis-trans isomerase [Ideonella livida]